MKTLLVPTDFSKGAEKALNYAIEFAKTENAKLILLHAYSVNYPAAETPLYIIDEIESAARGEAEMNLKSLEVKIKHSGKIDVELHAEEGAPDDIILGLAKDLKIDMIVMGTQGVNTIANRIFGSTAVRVIEKAICPVITIPENCAFKPIQKISYATNYDKQDIRNLRLVSEFAEHLNAQLNILHIADEEKSTYYDKTMMQDFMDKVNKEIPYSNLSFQILNSQDLKESFYKYIESNAADLIVMATHHHTFFERLFGKSVTGDLAKHINIPLMAFHNPVEVELEIKTPPIHTW